LSPDPASRADRPDVLGPILHPPLGYLVTMALGLLVQRALPLRVLPAAAARSLGTVLLVPGLALLGSALAAFRRAGTSVAPIHPTRALVTGGPYRLTRNPMYAGLALGYAGVAVMLDALWPLLLLLPLLLVIDVGVVRVEEQFMERLFGDAYRDYRSRVRRWL
jgi:protein-S-isoprenylcysteine O-methyltransferase Ste14